MNFLISFFAEAYVLQFLIVIGAWFHASSTNTASRKPTYKTDQQQQQSKYSYAVKPGPSPHIPTW